MATRIIDGDIIDWLASSGIHSNGYSLVRKVLLEQGGMEAGSAMLMNWARPWGKSLLTPTRIYVKSSIGALLDELEVKGIGTYYRWGYSGKPAKDSALRPGSDNRAFSLGMSAAIFEMVSRLGRGGSRRKCTVPSIWASAML